MGPARWSAEEKQSLKWFVEKREEHLEALRRNGVRERMGERKWTWSDIAIKMQKVAERDEWETNRIYDATSCTLAWQAIQAHEAGIKSEAEDVFMSGGSPRIKQEYETGSTVDAYPLEVAAHIEASPAPVVSSSQAQGLSDAAARDMNGQIQVRFESGLDHMVDVRFDAASKVFTVAPKVAPKLSVGEAEVFPKSDRRIKTENVADPPLDLYSPDSPARVRSLQPDSSSNPSPARYGESYTPELQNGSSSLAENTHDEAPTRLNARWEDHEIEALDWFIEKRNKESVSRRPQMRERTWTWEGIAAKMNIVAERDGWARTRIYTAGNCYGAWSTKSTRLATSRPSVARRHQTIPALAARSGQEISRVGATVGEAIQDTINGPPPPGPDAGGAPVPYHWTRGEREALHDVYVFSRIAENKLLSRGECRRRGNWTWGMVAREMNRRSQEAAWSVGRVYDQSNCYNMIKYEKDNFNLEGNLQPLQPDSEPKNENEHADEEML